MARLETLHTLISNKIYNVHIGTSSNHQKVASFEQKISRCTVTPSSQIRKRVLSWSHTHDIDIQYIHMTDSDMTQTKKMKSTTNIGLHYIHKNKQL